MPVFFPKAYILCFYGRTRWKNIKNWESKPHIANTHIQTRMNQWSTHLLQEWVSHCLCFPLTLDTLWISIHEIVLFSLPGPGLSQWGSSKPWYALPFTMGKILQHCLFTQDDIKHNLSKRRNVSLKVHYEHSEWGTVVDWALLKAYSVCHSGVC